MPPGRVSSPAEPLYAPRDTKAQARRRRRQKRAERQDPQYLGYVAGLPCLVCGVYRVEVHHQPRKSQAGWHDTKTAPLCREHHRGLAGIHMQGLALFNLAHGLDLDAEVARIRQEYLDAHR